MKDKNFIYNLFIIIHTTRYNVVRLKAMHKISPLEELVGGDLPPSSSQRLTGMLNVKGNTLNFNSSGKYWEI
jgi:hypothetical protein